MLYSGVGIPTTDWMPSHRDWVIGLGGGTAEYVNTNLYNAVNTPAVTITGNSAKMVSVGSVRFRVTGLVTTFS